MKSNCDIIRRTVRRHCVPVGSVGWECDLLVLHVLAITRIREHRFKSASDFLCGCRYIPGLIDDGLNFGRDRLLLTPVRKVYPRARVYRRSSMRHFQFKDPPCGVLHPEWINSVVWLSNSNTAVRFFFVYN